MRSDPADSSVYDVAFTDDPAAFLAVAEAALAADPVVSSVMTTVTARLRAEPAAAEGPRWWAVVRDGDGGVAGLAMRTARTAPHPIFVLPMPDEAARTLARKVNARGEVVGGVNGALPAAETCAAELARLQGERVEVEMHTRLFELGELRAPRNVPGRLRAATLEEIDTVREWLDRFLPDADEQAGRAPAHGGEPVDPAEVRRGIEAGLYWFWIDDDGTRVNLTGANPPAFGVARIAPVYTPPPQRRKGYAGAAVAAVSRLLLDAGARVCLYTDQANPTANRVYQAIGYRPVVDQVNLRIVARP